MTTGTDDLHVVVGASGGTGGAVVRELARRGHRVRAVNRRGNADAPAGVERLAADVATAEGAKAAGAGATVVYHCAQPPYTRWPREFPPLTDAVAAGVADAGAKLVLADNLYAYGRHDGPLTEDLPAAATGRKGRVRALMAERLLDAHRQGRLRVAIGRSSDYYGPGGLLSVAGERVFRAALAGRTVRWLGRLDQPHTLSYLEDMAAGLVLLGERDEADGQVWHLPAAEPITGRQFLELVVAATGGNSRIATSSASTIRLAGVFVPFLRELGETLPNFQAPYVLDWSRFRRAFGPYTPTPYGEAVARTVAWFRDHPRTS
jgi:nucleoside-diphosphate-sugar epimerase